MTAQIMQIGNKPCRIYGEPHAEYLLLQMTGEHELQSMDSEVAAIAQSAHHFLFAAIPVESWNDALSPWKSPAVWGKQGFGGKAADTLRFLTEQVIPSLKQQFDLPENVKIILGGYSLAVIPFPEVPNGGNTYHTVLPCDSARCPDHYPGRFPRHYRLKIGYHYARQSH